MWGEKNDTLKLNKESDLKSGLEATEVMHFEFKAAASTCDLSGDLVIPHI